MFACAFGLYITFQIAILWLNIRDNPPNVATSFFHILIQNPTHFGEKIMVC